MRRAVPREPLKKKVTLMPSESRVQTSFTTLCVEVATAS